MLGHFSRAPKRRAVPRQAFPVFWCVALAVLGHPGRATSPSGAHFTCNRLIFPFPCAHCAFPLPHAHCSLFPYIVSWPYRLDPTLAHILWNTSIFLVLERVGKEIGNCKILCWGSPHTHTHTQNWWCSSCVCASYIIQKKKTQGWFSLSHTHTHSTNLFTRTYFKGEIENVLCTEKSQICYN